MCAHPSLLIMCSGSLFSIFHPTEHTVNKTRKESVLVLGDFCPSKGINDFAITVVLFLHAVALITVGVTFDCQD